MSYKHASVKPLALFLKPQSPAERLAAQQRDREKLQRERQLKGLQEEAKGKGKGRGWEEACGVPARLQEQASTPHSPLLYVESREWLLLHVFPSPLFPCF